jgi:hypothetical protein
MQEKLLPLTPPGIDVYPLNDLYSRAYSRMNPYVQYIESRGNLVAIKDLSSMWGVFSESCTSTSLLTFHFVPLLR